MSAESMIQMLKGRLGAILARVDHDAEAIEAELWEVRRLLSALRSSLGGEAERISRLLHQVEIRLATVRGTQIAVELAGQKRVVERRLAAGETTVAAELLARVRQELHDSAPILGLTRRGQISLRELGSGLDDLEARLLAGGKAADRTLGLQAARVRILGEALVERLNRGAYADAVTLWTELGDEVARLRDNLPSSPVVINAESLLARAEKETREHREQAAVARLIEDATGSLEWLRFAVARRRIHDAIQSRENLIEAVAELRTRHAANFEARAFLAEVDDALARAERALGTDIARLEGEQAANRARSLMQKLARSGSLDAAGLLMSLEEVASYLRRRKSRAPELGPWIRRIETALEGERQRRRPACGMVIGVLNDVVYGEASFSQAA